MSKIKNVKMYECEECGETYEDEEDADDCCSQGGLGSAIFAGAMLGAVITMLLVFTVIWDGHIVGPSVLNGICKEKYGTNYSFHNMENRDTITCQKVERIDGQNAYIKIIGGENGK